jgi:hypothetical protein
MQCLSAKRAVDTKQYQNKNQKKPFRAPGGADLSSLFVPYATDGKPASAIASSDSSYC